MRRILIGSIVAATLAWIVIIVSPPAATYLVLIEGTGRTCNSLTSALCLKD